MKEVESYFFLPKGTVCSANRGKAAVEARSIAAVLCKEHTRFSWKELGEIFEKDHSSLLNCSRIVREKPDVNVIYDKLNIILEEKYLNNC
jgi:chromosomal replication initiation ATPase DnaA